MGFFKDFKDDLSQAVDDLSEPTGSALKKTEENEEKPHRKAAVVDEDIDAANEAAITEALQSAGEEKTEEPEQLSFMDMEPGPRNSEDTAEQKTVEEQSAQDTAEAAEAAEEAPEVPVGDTLSEGTIEEAPEEKSLEEAPSEEITEAVPVQDTPEWKEPEDAGSDMAVGPSDSDDAEQEPVFDEAEETKEIKTTNSDIKEREEMSDNLNENAKAGGMELDDGPATDESSVITGGMSINGNITSEGSLDVLGTVDGNIVIKGKLTVSGNIKGDSKASEIFADSAKITGQVVSTGSVKVGQASVILGNISATSAVIAGAVKGDIDVHGPVILDTSAIVMGDIKSKSVQINNGAVIEGHCSQCYADVSPTSFFKDIKEN